MRIEPKKRATYESLSKNKTWNRKMKDKKLRQKDIKIRQDCLILTP